MQASDIRSGSSGRDRRVLRLQWNSLQVGDRVLVHASDGPDRRLVAGVVSMVEQSTGSNDVSVRLRSAIAGERVIQPARLAVHFDPIGLEEQCWRCQGPGR